MLTIRSLIDSPAFCFITRAIWATKWCSLHPTIWSSLWPQSGPRLLGLGHRPQSHPEMKVWLLMTCLIQVEKSIQLSPLCPFCFLTLLNEWEQNGLLQDRTSQGSSHFPKRVPVRHLTYPDCRQLWDLLLWVTSRNTGMMSFSIIFFLLRENTATDSSQHTLY